MRNRIRKFATVQLWNAPWLTVERVAELSGSSVAAVRAAIQKHDATTKVVTIGETAHTLVDRSILSLMLSDL